MRLAVTAGMVVFLTAYPCPAQSKSSKAPAKPSPAEKSPKAKPQADPWHALLTQADAAIARGDFAPAIASLKKYAAERPTEAYPHFQLGYAYTGQKDWPAAIAAYRRAIELDARMGEAHLNLGLILVDRGAAEEALAPLGHAVTLLPANVQAKFVLGAAYESAGKSKEAALHYRAAAVQDAQNPEYPLSLGRVLLNAGDFAEAQRSFAAALQLRPDVAAARLGLAQTFIAQKKLAEAIPALELYLRAVPDDAVTRAQLAAVLFETGDAQRALVEVDRAESVAAPTAATQKLRVEIYLQQKRLDDALPLIERILTGEPNSADLRALAGRLHLAQRDFPAAERELRAALRLQPSHLDALRDLASTLYLAENYPAALQAQDMLAQRETPPIFFWFVRATCFDKLGRKAEAVAAYEKFVALDQGRTDKQDFQARQRIRILRRELEKKP
jgi:tetratricopeptide (TPR) repeat protein